MLALCGQTMHFLSNGCDGNDVMAALMAHLIQLSKQQVEEHFSYRGFKRFSAKNSVLAIGGLSYQTRHVSQAEATPAFIQDWQKLNQAVDLQRVPQINPTAYGMSQLAFFNQLGTLKGFAPLMPFSVTESREKEPLHKQFSNVRFLTPNIGV